MPKDGHTRGRQVYKCGDCKRKYTADAEQVAAASAARDSDASEIARNFDIQQANFTETLRVEGVSIPVRFRVMAQSPFIRDMSGFEPRELG